MNKGSLRLIAETSKADTPAEEYGSSHDNTYRGLPDAALVEMTKMAARVAATLGKPTHPKESAVFLERAGRGDSGPFAVTLRSITTKNDGTVTDTGEHTFAGLSRNVIDKMNDAVLQVGRELAAIAKMKG